MWGCFPGPVGSSCLQVSLGCAWVLTSALSRPGTIPLWPFSFFGHGPGPPSCSAAYKLSPQVQSSRWPHTQDVHLGTPAAINCSHSRYLTLMSDIQQHVVRKKASTCSEYTNTRRKTHTSMHTRVRGSWRGQGENDVGHTGGL